MTMIISKDGEPAMKVERSSFKNEDYLQSFISHNPDCLPLYEIDEDIQLLVLAREFPTTSGPIDALAMDKDGNIYLIETKLYTNSDKRHVVAQVLDYGAALWKGYADPSEFITIIDQKTKAEFKIGLNEKIMDFFGLTEEDISLFHDSIRHNLQQGQFSFVVLMDKMDDRLKDLIIFINQNSQFTVYGVELEYYKHDNYELIIPHLFGAEVKKSLSTASPPRKCWDETNFMADARNRLTAGQCDTLQKLYRFSQEIADQISWGTGRATGSFNPKVEKAAPRSLYSVFSDGRLWLNFHWVDESIRNILWEEIRKADLFVIADDSYEKQITIEKDQWMPKIDTLIEVLQKVYAQSAG